MKIKSIVNLILIQIILLSLIGCIDQNIKEREKEIEATVKKYYMKKIIFPDSLFVYHRDTVIIMDSTMIKDRPFKILAFISGECTPCIQKLFEWVSFHNELEKFNSVQIFFVIQNVDHEYFIQMFKQEIPYKYSLLFDPHNEFFEINKLPPEKLFQTMLLNIENKIIITGNPIYNKDLKELYINILKKNSYEED